MNLELLILIQIEEAPKHGYEIKKEIQKHLGYLMDVNHNLLYPTLRRFTEEGIIHKKVNEQQGKPTQFVYEITEAGKARITELINEFTVKDAKHQIEFMVRVSLFDQMDSDLRLRILNRRKKDLETLLVDMFNRLEQSSSHIYRSEVLRYSIAQIKSEMQWIDDLIHTSNLS